MGRPHLALALLAYGILARAVMALRLALSLSKNATCCALPCSIRCAI